ncbi:Evolutionarily conserved C-terminal region 11 [Rhizina undulata]
MAHQVPYGVHGFRKDCHSRSTHTDNDHRSHLQYGIPPFVNWLAPLRRTLLNLELNNSGAAHQNLAETAVSENADPVVIKNIRMERNWLHSAPVEEGGGEVEKYMRILNWNLPNSSSPNKSRPSNVEAEAATSMQAPQEITTRALANSKAHRAPQILPNSAGGAQGGALGCSTAARASGDFSTEIAGGNASRTLIYDQEGGQRSNMQTSVVGANRLGPGNLKNKPLLEQKSSTVHSEKPIQVPGAESHPIFKQPLSEPPAKHSHSSIGKELIKAMEPFAPIDPIDSAFGKYNRAYGEAKRQEEELTQLRRTMEQLELDGEEQLYQPRYFMIKVSNDVDMEAAMRYSAWSSTIQGNNKLNAVYFAHHRNGSIYLFFSKKSSGKFSGIAEMKSRVDFGATLGIFSSKNWKGSFELQWHLKQEVPLSLFAEMRNMDGNPVSTSRDADEIHYSVGNEMMRLMYQLKPFQPRVRPFPRVPILPPGRQTWPRGNANFNTRPTYGNIKPSFGRNFSNGSQRINQNVHVAPNANNAYPDLEQTFLRGPNNSAQQANQLVSPNANYSYERFEQPFVNISSNEGLQDYCYGAGNCGPAPIADFSQQPQNNTQNGRQENLGFITGFSGSFRGAPSYVPEPFHVDDTSGCIQDSNSVYSQGLRENHIDMPHYGTPGNWGNQTLRYHLQHQVNDQIHPGTHNGFNDTAFPGSPGYMDNSFHPENRSPYHARSHGNFDEGYTMGDYRSAHDVSKPGEHPPAG